MNRDSAIIRADVCCVKLCAIGLCANLIVVYISML